MKVFHRHFLRSTLLGIIVIWIVFVVLAIGEETKRQPDAIEKQFGLKPGAGRELVLANCMPCHSTAIVASNHLKRDKWDELITTMQEKHGMIKIPDPIRQKILDYLEKAQRPEDVGLNAGKETPWATPLYRPNPLWE